MGGGPVLVAAVPTGALVAAFVAAAAVSLLASGVLVVRLERLGASLGLSEAMLGMVAALAANGPEITSAVTALLRHERRIGAGVVLGSNAFNLAALLGLGAVVAGTVHLHRRVVVLAGGVSLWLALCALGGVGTGGRPWAALVGALVVVVPYLAVSAAPGAALRRGVPPPVARWLRQAVSEEELELLPAVHPRPGGRRRALEAAGALAVVIAASAVMEATAATFGSRSGLSAVVTGAVVLAAVTSLPNAVAALYLARRGRGAAVLSTALNSNNLNVVLGLLVPGTAVGLGAADAGGLATAGFAVGLTALVCVLAFRHGRLTRLQGVGVLAGYAGFLVTAAVVGG
ncbi:MAG: hypothetical protein KGJ77_00165 [Acidobacteriota bacterium]|nr:hypothetical protein [Acidobacteriota bacterium]